MSTQTQSRPFKKLNCHPKNKTKKFTCYDDNELIMIKDAWNQLYPNNKIYSTQLVDIWNELVIKFTSCMDEKCWADTLKIHTNSFAPKAPNDWLTNTWLSNDDIISVLKQYKESYPNFEYLGPSTLDFDTMNSERCHNLLCKANDKIFRLNIADKVKKGINKIGISINFVKLGGFGKHWVTLFVDLEKKFIFYFDSCGTKIPEQIKRLINRIQSQCVSIGFKMAFHHNEHLRHQMTKTECGMYSLYSIISLLEGKHTPQYFNTHRIPDKDVERYRRIYFN